jgi:transcriptional regulator
MLLRKRRPDALQGTLDLLVLKTLTSGPAHGYAIASHIQQVSNDVLRVEEGSLYPALHRLEQAGAIAAEWRLTEQNRRVRIYRLTRAGHRHLQQEQDKWDELTRAVSRVLRCA